MYGRKRKNKSQWKARAAAAQVSATTLWDEGQSVDLLKQVAGIMVSH